MGANLSRPQDSSFSSMGIRRPGLSSVASSGTQNLSNQVKPGAVRPGIKFGAGQSTRFD